MSSSTLTLIPVSAPSQRDYDDEDGFCQDRLPTSLDLKRRLDRLQLGSQNVKVVIEGVQVALVGRVADKSARDAMVNALLTEEGVTSVTANGVATDTTGASNTKKQGLVYNVKEGDTLFAIAKEIYGDGQRFTDLFNANRDVLTDPNKINPGQALSVPTPIIGMQPI